MARGMAAPQAQFRIQVSSLAASHQIQMAEELLVSLQAKEQTLLLMQFLEQAQNLCLNFESLQAGANGGLKISYCLAW